MRDAIRGQRSGTAVAERGLNIHASESDTCIIRCYNQLDIISVRTARTLLPIERRCGSLISLALPLVMSLLPKELATPRASLAMIFAISEALRRRFPRWEASMIAVAQRSICTRQCERSGHRCSGEFVESGGNVPCVSSRIMHRRRSTRAKRTERSEWGRG